MIRSLSPVTSPPRGVCLSDGFIRACVTTRDKLADMSETDPAGATPQTQAEQAAETELARATDSAIAVAKAATESGLTKDPAMAFLIKLSILVGIIFTVVGGTIGSIFAFRSLNATSAPAPTATPVPAPATRPAPIPLPRFVFTGGGWGQVSGVNSCDQSACAMVGTFRNEGGDGTAAATFYVWADKQRSTPLAHCTVAIPEAPENGTVGAGCTAISADLEKYIQNRGGLVSMSVEVDNPSRSAT